MTEPLWYRITITVIWLLIALMVMTGALVRIARAQDRFGDYAGWRLVEPGKVTKFENENDCWHAYFGNSVSLRRDAYCEPEKKWVMIEQSRFGVDTTGFKSEFGCFMSGVVASHQQGVEASCQYLGDTAGSRWANQMRGAT